MTISSGMFLGGQTGIREVDAYVVTVNPHGLAIPPDGVVPRRAMGQAPLPHPDRQSGAMTAAISLNRSASACPCPMRSSPTGRPCLSQAADVLDLSVYRGDSGRFQVTVTEADGTTPVDISAATWLADIHTVDDAPRRVRIEPLAGQPHIVEVILTAAVSAPLDELAVHLGPRDHAGRRGDHAAAGGLGDRRGGRLRGDERLRPSPCREGRASGRRAQRHRHRRQTIGPRRACALDAVGRGDRRPALHHRGRRDPRRIEVGDRQGTPKGATSLTRAVATSIAALVSAGLRR